MNILCKIFGSHSWLEYPAPYKGEKTTHSGPDKRWRICIRCKKQQLSDRDWDKNAFFATFYNPEDLYKKDEMDNEIINEAIRK